MKSRYGNGTVALRCTQDYDFEKDTIPEQVFERT